MGKLAGLTAIAKVAAGIGNIGQARAVLGAVADTIQKAYNVLPTVSSVEGIRDNFAERLDHLNTTATGLYAIYAGATPDLFDQEITTQHAMQIGWTISTANELFNDIEAQGGVTYFSFSDIATQALVNAGTWVGQGVDAVAKPLAAGGAALLEGLWPYLLGAGLILGLYWYRAPLLRALKGARPT